MVGFILSLSENPKQQQKNQTKCKTRNNTGEDEEDEEEATKNTIVLLFFLFYTSSIILYGCGESGWKKILNGENWSLKLKKKKKNALLLVPTLDFKYIHLTIIGH